MVSQTPLLIAIILLLILLVIGSILIFRMYRSLLFRNNIFGRTLPVRIFTLTVSSYFFSFFFPALFIEPFFLVRQPVERIITGFNLLQDSKIRVTPAKAASLVTGMFDFLFSELDARIFTFTVLAGVLVACLINAALYGMFYDKNTGIYEMQKRSGLFLTKCVSNIKGSSYKTRQNIALALLMTGSLYLILSVTIAIPYNNSLLATPDAKTDSLTYQINIPESGIMNMSMESFTKDSADFFTKIRNQPVDKLNATAVEFLHQNNELLQRDVNDRYMLLEKEVKQYNSSLADFEKKKKMKVDDFNRRLKNNDRSPKLKYTYFLLLQDYIASEIRYKESDFLSVQSRIADDYTFIIRQRIANYTIDYDNFIKRLEALNDAQTTTPYFSDYFGLAKGSGYFHPLNDAALSLDWGPVPKEPVPGAEWGWLGESASWLIKPNSPDLVLIIGMFGFGMLGAAISCFVNIAPRTKRQQPLIEDLHIVIIRGFSAAIVIFLATKGGIAIINNGNNNPNPHVLFFTCLVGAVFSERIWDWAKKQLALKIDNTSTTDTTAAGKEENDAYKTITSKAVEVPDVTLPKDGAIDLL